MADHVGDHVGALLDEVRLLFHRAVQVVEHLHHDEPVTASGRAVLEHLHRHGPASVSELARRRHVTRQHIQTVVNGLLEQELVSAGKNPAHRRSPLIALNRPGAQLIARMIDAEQQVLAELPLPLTATDLDQARRTLAAVRDAMGAHLDRSS